MTENYRERPAAGTTPLVPDEALEAVMERVRAEGAELLGADGLLTQLTKAVLERALAEELTDHLGYEKGDPAGAGSGNSRNGATPKRVHTDVGTVDVDAPRDRNGSFEPRIVPKGTSRLEGFDDKIIAFCGEYKRVINEGVWWVRTRLERRCFRRVPSTGRVRRAFSVTVRGDHTFVDSVLSSCPNVDAVNPVAAGW